MGHGDPPAVRAEPGRPPRRARVVARRPCARSMSQTVRAQSGKMRGRQVAAVGAEAEDEDVAIAPGLEAGDLLVVGDAADLDRPIPEPERIAGHGGVEGGQQDSRRAGG